MQHTGSEKSLAHNAAGGSSPPPVSDGVKGASEKSYAPPAKAVDVRVDRHAPEDVGRASTIVSQYSGSRAVSPTLSTSSRKSYAEIVRSSSPTTPVNHNLRKGTNENKENEPIPMVWDHGTQPSQVAEGPSPPTTPVKSRSTIMDKDGFVVPKRTANVSPVSPIPIRSTSRFFGSWFDEVEESLASKPDKKTTDDVRLTQAASAPSAHRSEPDHKAFMAQIIKSIPSRDRQLILNRADKVEQMNKCRSSKMEHLSCSSTSIVNTLQSDVNGDPTQSNVASNMKPANESSFSERRYTRSEKGKGRARSANTPERQIHVKTFSRDPNPATTDQIEADTLLAQQIAHDQVFEEDRHITPPPI
ncbi:hypothetical protein M422DRAFT_51003 [Sphaerobolus stellatus SS14]|nr:hypothetical protein M422DRAFT_51003 [Sphaerobolus stellatus SS14]